jgi:hypothetical protein
MNILLNQWTNLRYHDPENVLIEFRKIENYIQDKQIDEKVRSLRTNKLKRHKEGREAALFCYGLGKSVLNTKVFFALSESSDYDIVSCWNDGKDLVYTPVQLKEVVSDLINPKASLVNEIAKLSKYSNSQNLVVAIHFNKKVNFDFRGIRMPDLKIAELWLFGALKPDQSEWFIYGNLLNTANFYKFSYPLVK